MDPIKLDKRLRLAASMVRKGRAAADIGTDHGYLAIYLAQREICPQVIACDLREGPLSAARRNVETRGLSDRIDLRLCDGLSGVAPGECDDIILAGMGGVLISRIIDAAAWVKNSQIRLVLQPMSHGEALRKYLCEAGFKIIMEQTAALPGHAYTVMQAVYTGEIAEPDDLMLAVGLIRDPNEGDNAIYLRKQQNRALKRAAGLQKGGDPAAARAFALAQRIDQLLRKGGTGDDAEPGHLPGN